MLYIFPTNTCFGIACRIDDIQGYHKIYNLKKRSLDKPLAILVPDFSWLGKYTTLTKEQIDNLQSYEQPFTVLTDCSYMKLWIEYENPENSEHFQNRDIYKQFAFRVAHTPEQKKLTKQEGPLFLTSANYSHAGEIYTYDELEITFGNLIENGKIKYIGQKEDLDENPPSHIFKYIGASLDKKYIRK